MSVIKAKRKPTPFRVITNFIQIRKSITELIYHSFKYKPRVGDDVEFCQWFIRMERDKIFKLLQEADRYIIMANSIYPAHVYEFEQRRELQNAALGLCFDILQEFQYILETLGIDINKYMIYVTAINEEIQLIRGWRQADNQKRKALQKQEEKQSPL